MHLPNLKQKTTEELLTLADQLGARLDCGGVRENPPRRQALILSILAAQEAERDPITADGVLEILPDGFGFLRTLSGNYQPCPDDIYVSPSQIRRFSLRTGDTVYGQIRPPKESERYYALLKVESINGDDPERCPRRRDFDDLTPQAPTEKFALADDPAQVTTRIVDLLCPIGRGQRCLIVGPPRTGKSTLIQALAEAITRAHDDVVVISVLVDARPEDITEARERGFGELVASRFDEPATRHVQMAEIALAKATRLAEKGRDVVVLLDSLTHLARARAALDESANKPAGARGEPTPEHDLRRLLASAAKLAEGGSLSVIATLHDHTGVAADDELARSLAGVESARIQLDAALMERRLFPCIDIFASGTRREEQLLPADTLDAIRTLRTRLHPLGTVGAITRLRSEMRTHETNSALLEHVCTALEPPTSPPASPNDP